MADGSGRPGFVPSFRDSVSRFLATSEGRAYLGRVPGTSQSLLDDRARADVLNWIVTEFDRRHLPPDFEPYSEDELARYRRDPVSQAGVERSRLLQLANDSSVGPPAQFAVCGACHTTATDGASSMGPNLRGIEGRRAGTLSGYAYSAAMRDSQIVWSRAELDVFLTNPASKVPGTYMPFAGIVDAVDRSAILDYLTSLR